MPEANSFRIDRAAVDRLLGAYPAGFGALFFAADTPVARARLRDIRNEFSIPARRTGRTLADALWRP